MTAQEQSLLEIFRHLSEHDAHSLLRFAECLAGYEQTTATLVGKEATMDKDSDEPEAHLEEAQTDDIPLPEKIERPQQERVVDALKRLSTTYPMLDKKILLDKASELVAQHVMFGKPAKEVIDQIEEMFADAYAKFAADARRGQ